MIKWQNGFLGVSKAAALGWARGPGKRSERRSRLKAICPNAMRSFWKVAAFRLTDSIRIQSGRRALRCFQNVLHHFIILNLKWYYATWRGDLCETVAQLGRPRRHAAKRSTSRAIRLQPKGCGQNRKRQYILPEDGLYPDHHRRTGKGACARMITPATAIARKRASHPNPDVSQIREAMRGKAERDPRRERAGARDQADRSDNTASRACRFEVSAEHHRRDRPYLAEPHNSLLPNKLHPFSRNRVESRGGAVSFNGPVSTPPLIKPDVRVSRIRLSDQGVFMLLPTGSYSWLILIGLNRGSYTDTRPGKNRSHDLVSYVSCITTGVAVYRCGRQLPDRLC